MKKILLYTFSFFVLYLNFLLPCFSQLDFGKEPLDVVIAVDVSKSVDNLSTVKKALTAWMKKVLKPGDRVCIIQFANKPEKSPSFTITDNNMAEIVKYLPSSPAKDGDYTDLASATMESLLHLTNYYYDIPLGTTAHRKQYLLMVSDFLPDPPFNSPYYDQKGKPYLRYKKAMNICLQGYNPYQLLSVKLKAFTLKAPLDSLEPEPGSDIDEWWLKFLQSIMHPDPVKVPDKDKEELKKFLEDMKSNYKKDSATLKLTIIPVDEHPDWGEVPLKGITFKKDFLLTGNHKYIVLKNISIKVMIENLSGESSGPISLKNLDIKFQDKSIKGLKVNDNILTISEILYGKRSEIPITVEITIPGMGGFSTNSREKFQGDLAFELHGDTYPVEKYNVRFISELGLKEKDLKTFFPVKKLEDKKKFNFSLTFERSLFLLYLFILLAIIIIIVFLVIILFVISKAGRPVSVSLKLEGIPPVVHNYELKRTGSIEILGGTFTTPDQFELPDVEGLAATIQRQGNKYFLIPDKGSIINETGEAISVQKEIKFGDHFTLRMERVKGGTTDFSFEFQRAGISDVLSEELGSILEEDSHIVGQIDTGDLL